MMSNALRMTVTSAGGLLKQSPCSAARVFTTATQAVPVQMDRLPPPEPGICCGQGCANCVWLVYANELIDYYHGEDFHKVAKEIEKKVSDINVRAYVLSELRIKWKKAH
ncbi:unnamed protein product [Cylicocyclus nassatus]|uniref:Oxidoreductase-like domain-containing protein n=1 Tax=Cylicocyclus nassatus TaxID=53992 RepID=A0AA36H8G2_CYLNA|nr:unnamed protein product [Cylicocyclus nassatus]